MKRRLPVESSAVRSLRLLALIGSLSLLPLLAWADFPAWWQQRGALRVVGGQPVPADDYAALNQGQLKNFAVAAYDELEARLTTPVAGVSGAGPQIEALIKGWFLTEGGNFVLNGGQRQPKATAATDDYAAVNLGQLKTVAAPFYDRLIAIGYASGYPWNAAGHGAADDYALANLGQLKQLFNFELDADHNGLLDVWELANFGHTGVNPNALAARGDGRTIMEAYLLGLNPNDLFDGQAPLLQIVSGNNQGNFPNAVLAKPLVVRVLDHAGHPLKNAVVQFAIASGSGQLTPLAGGITNLEGLGQTSLQLPGTIGQIVSVNATAGHSGATTQVVFTASVGDINQPPAAPSTPIITLQNGDVDALIAWEDNSNNETAFYVDRTDDGETWERRGTLSAGATEFTDHQLIPNRSYFYRIVAHN